MGWLAPGSSASPSEKAIGDKTNALKILAIFSDF
jgi:hypothetical protein